jgi:hypothetical protein
MSNTLKIVDAHEHLGECRVFGSKSTEDELRRRMEESGIHAMIVQPFAGPDDPVKAHDQIAELCAKYPGRFFGLACLNPHCDRSAYQHEIERCVRELKFVGVKLQTLGHAVLPLSEDGNMVFQTAHDLGIPVMVHTGPGIPFASPSLCIPLARKYPKLKIILAHAGAVVFSADAQVAASVCNNIYLETSWCSGMDIRWMIQTIGPDRVMMGADVETNIPVEVAKFKALNLDPETFAKVMSTTAIETFKLPC